MKKIIKIFMIIILLCTYLFILTGCGAKEEVKNETKKTNQVATENESEEQVSYLEFPDKSEEERQILERYSNNNDYKVIEISESKFKGYLIAIYEPERVNVVTSSKIGVEGEYVTEMSEKNKSFVAINAGGFSDENFNGDGGTPLGITVTKNDMVTTTQYKNGNAGVIGFNSENKLVLEKYTSDEVKSNGIRDCISFGPYLIKNGETEKLTGTGALGPSSRAARTVIGQREDGIVLFLVVDGDRTKSEGATLGEVTDIMKKYGAINAANLDGGTSSQMTIGTTLINDPTSMNGEHRTRPVSTAFILSPDDSNNGDNTVVKDKIK